MPILRHAALAMSRKNFDYIKHGQRDEYGNMKVKMLKSNIVTSPVEMLLAKVTIFGSSE